MAILIFEGGNGIAGILTYWCSSVVKLLLLIPATSHGDLRGVPLSLEMGKNSTYAPP